MTLENLAAILGVTPDVLGCYERGRMALPGVTLAHAARALGRALAWFMPVGADDDAPQRTIQAPAVEEFLRHVSAISSDDDLAHLLEIVRSLARPAQQFDAASAAE